MSWWPFPVFRNYSTDPELTTIFAVFAATDDLQILAETEFKTTVASAKIGQLSFWSANRYFAWASEGEYEGLNGTTKTWRRRMPSRSAVRSMRDALNAARILRGVTEGPERAAGDAGQDDTPEHQAVVPPANAPSSAPSPIGMWNITYAPPERPDDDVTLRDLHAGFAMAGILASVRAKADLADIQPAAFYAWADALGAARTVERPSS